MAIVNLNKSEDFMTNTTEASKYIPRRPRISINWNPPFQTSLHKISKVDFFRLTKNFFRNKIFLFLKKKIVSLKKNSFQILWSEVWKGGFQLMLILGLLGMYFDAAVVFVKNSSLLFRLTVAILCALTIFFANFTATKDEKYFSN